MKLELLARQYLLGFAAGAPAILDADSMAETRRRYGFYGHARIPPK